MVKRRDLLYKLNYREKKIFSSPSMMDEGYSEKLLLFFFDNLIINYWNLKYFISPRLFIRKVNKVVCVCVPSQFLMNFLDQILLISNINK